MKNRRLLRNLLLSIPLTVLFLYLALREIDWAELSSVIHDARWAYLPLAFTVWALALGARAIRWHVLLDRRIALRSAFHILSVGFLVNGVIPLRIGELARAYLVGQNATSSTTSWAALSTIVAERLLDMLATVLILPLTLPFLAADEGVVLGGLVLGSVALAGFITLLTFAFRPAWAHALLGFVLRILPLLQRLHPEQLLDRILDGLKPLTTRRGLRGAILWTGIAWSLSVAGAWVLALVFPALPQTATMRAALTLSIATASFSLIVPFTVANVGPFEAATIFALMTAGVSEEVALVYAVLWHVGTVIHFAIWGGLGMFSLGLSLGRVRTAAETLPPPPAGVDQPVAR